MGFNPLKTITSFAEKAVRVVAEPAKHIVNEVIDVGADVGEHLGKGVRRVAGPFIGVIDDLHNALMPRLRFDLNVAGKFDANVTWPRTTDFDINLNLPGFPKESAPPAAMLGDITGGFFSNITADRERLRSARRRLQLVRHIAQRGHRFGAEDTFNVIVSYVPDEPWAFADAADGADAVLPVFKVSIKEPGSQKHEYFVRVSEVARGRLKEQKKQLVASTKPADALSPLLRNATPSATENITLLRMSNANGQNQVQISVSATGGRKIHPAAAGTLSVALVRQSAYLRDSVFFAELKVEGAAAFVPRDITANVDLTEEFRRTTTPGAEFPMKKGDTETIGKVLEKAIDEAGPLKLDPLPKERAWQDRAFEMNMRLAEKTESIAYYLDELRERLRDLGSADSFDVRGKAVACFRPSSLEARCNNFEARLQTDSDHLVLSINELRPDEHVTFFVPISSTKRSCDLTCACEASPVKPAGPALTPGQEIAQLDLSYGWLDMMDVCQSAITVVPAGGGGPNRSIKTPLTFTSANHFE